MGKLLKSYLKSAITEKESRLQSKIDFSKETAKKESLIEEKKKEEIVEKKLNEAFDRKGDDHSSGEDDDRERSWREKSVKRQLEGNPNKEKERAGSPRKRSKCQEIKERSQEIHNQGEKKQFKDDILSTVESKISRSI